MCSNMLVEEKVLFWLQPADGLQDLISPVTFVPVILSLNSFVSSHIFSGSMQWLI